MWAALVLGVAGGLSPGPLHSLILTTALRRGPAAAARVAVAPLLSDTLPVGVALLVAATIPDRAVAILSIVGGVALIGLAVWSLRAGGPHAESPSGDYLKGAVTNVLNPNPWIFWLGAGAPLLSAAFERGVWWGVGWLAVFYVGLVGVKVALAVGVGRARVLLSDRALARSVVASALLLAAVGVWLIVSGFAAL